MKLISCKQCRERWDELLSKSTFADSPESAEVQAHLETCADCRNAFNLLAAARETLHQLPAQKAPDSLRANILSQIESQPKSKVAWLSDLFISPQRLAWVSGALVTVFLVALLMRPEHQTQVFQSAPKVLSNRGQVEEHNSAPQQSKSNETAPPPKTTQKKLYTKEFVKPNVTKKTTRENIVKATPSEFPKRQQNPSASTQIPLPEETIESPKPLSNREPETAETQPSQKPAKDKIASPQSQSFAAPAPAHITSETSDAANNEVNNLAKSSDSINPQKSMNRSMAAANSSAEVNGKLSAFKSQSIPEIIHWSKVLFSDYDVANAEISITVESGLTFADSENGDFQKRILWRGSLYRGKQIPLNADLQRTSNEAGKLHLSMIDTDTQKVLLDKELIIP